MWPLHPPGKNSARCVLFTLTILGTPLLADGVLAASTCAPTSALSLVSAPDLDSKIVRRMDTITASLNKVDAAVAAQNLKAAKSSLKSATAEMAKIHSWYGGKFNEKDPAFVALTKRLATATAAVGKTGPPVTKKETKKETKGDKSAKPLNGKVSRRVQTISAALDEVDKDVTRQDLKAAKVSLKVATKEMTKIREWHKGQFDESHPDFVAISARLEASIAQVEGGGGLAAQAASMAKDLGPVLDSLTVALADLEQELNAVRKQDSAFGYARGDAERLAGVIAAMTGHVERGTAIHAAAMETVSAFHTQFPDLSTLNNLVANGDDAIHTMERIEGFQGRWDKVRNGALSTYLPADIDDDLAAFARAEKNSDFSSGAIMNGEHRVGRLEEVQLFTAAVLGFGEQGSDVMKAQANNAIDLDEKIQILRVATAKAKGQEANERALKLGSARFPKATLTGGEWPKVERTLKTVFEGYTKDKKVERVTVHSAWDQRTEARWINNHWVVGTYRYVGGTLLAELPDGRFRVYRVSFRRTLRANGAFGALEVWGIGHSFEILAENINK